MSVYAKISPYIAKNFIVQANDQNLFVSASALQLLIRAPFVKFARSAIRCRSG